MQARIDTEFGSALRFWRSQRKTSQLELALSAEISQRHVSFLETGRAHPSREMVLHLAQVLDIPLRERNGLLRMAGFAPAYQQRSLEADDMHIVQQALAMALRHHEPYPAIVMDRHWNLLQANAPAQAWLQLLGDAETLWSQVDPEGGKNIYRLTFHPQGLQPLIKNWEQVYGHLLARLQSELEQAPGDEPLRRLLNDVKAMVSNTNVDIPSPARAGEGPPLPVIPMQLQFGAIELSLFSMISAFGTALDVTAEELRVESFFPADAVTRQFFEALVPRDD